MITTLPPDALVPTTSCASRLLIPPLLSPRPFLRNPLWLRSLFLEEPDPALGDSTRDTMCMVCGVSQPRVCRHSTVGDHWALALSRYARTECKVSDHCVPGLDLDGLQVDMFEVDPTILAAAFRLLETVVPRSAPRHVKHFSVPRQITLKQHVTSCSFTLQRGRQGEILHLCSVRRHLRVCRLRCRLLWVGNTSAFAMRSVNLNDQPQHANKPPKEPCGVRIRRPCCSTWGTRLDWGKHSSTQKWRFYRASQRREHRQSRCDP